MCVMEKLGWIYMEIIWIWDIVLDYCKLVDFIKVICNVYNWGLFCVLWKKLKGINKG